MLPVESCPIMFKHKSAFIPSKAENGRGVFDDAGSLSVGYREKRREGNGEGGKEEETT